MDFSYGKMLKVNYNINSEYIYLNSGGILKVKDKSIMLIYPDKVYEIPKEKSTL